MKVRLLFLALFLLPLFRLSAAELSEPTLPPVFVNSSRLADVAEPTTQVPGKVIVVTSEEIEKLGAKTVQEVLQYQTGVVLYDSVGNEFQQSVDLRGFNAQPVPATSVFVDGVRVNEPDFNSINFDLIPVEDIERIEILPGTATVFGRNALGGVINITTKRGRRDRPRFGFDIGDGSYARQQYSFNTDGPVPLLPNFDYYFGVTRELTNGFRDEFDPRDAGARITRIFTKLGYRLSETTDATLTYTRVLDDISQAGSLPGSRLRIDRNGNLTPGDSASNNLHQVAFNLKQRMSAGFSAAVNSFFRRNDQESFVRGLSSTSTLETGTDSGGTAAQLSHDGNLLGKKNLATLGAEYARNRFDTTSRSEFLCCPGAFVTEQLTRENVAGIYLTDSLTLFEPLVVTAGFRYDWNQLDFTGKTDPTLSGVKHFIHFSPKTGVVYTPLQSLSFYFNYSEGMRVPTVQEIFALGPFGSNLDLKAMTSRNFEIGLRSKPVPRAEASIALFYTPVRDEILFIATDPLDPFSGRNENIKKTLRRGIETSIKVRPADWIDGFINYTVMKATFEKDFFIPGINFLDPPRLVKKGDELPAVPRHRIGAGVNVRPLDGWTVSLLGSYVSEQYQLRDEPNQAKKVADYFVLNSRIAYQWRQWTTHVTLNNLTNRKYSTSGILVGDPFNESFRVPAPGFNVFAGLSFRY